MRFPRRDDPTDPTDPDEAMMMTNSLPKPLFWGLAKGAALLAVAVGLTWAAATLLQDRANVEQVATHNPIPASR